MISINLQTQSNIENSEIGRVLISLTRELEKLAPYPGVSALCDEADEYIQSRYNLGRKKAITAQFNKRAGWKHLMDAYLKDMPRRLGLECRLTRQQRKFYALCKNAPARAL